MLWRGDEIIPLGQVKDLTKRISPGEAVPSGECKECGALTHFVPIGSDLTIENVGMVLNGTLRDLLDKINEAVLELRKNNTLEVKRLEYNRTKETLAAVQKLAELSKAGMLPDEFGNIVEIIQTKMKKKKGEEEDGNTEAGGR